jgi:hypothetical protein
MPARFFERPGPLPPPSRQGDRLFRPEVPSIDKSPRNRLRGAVWCGSCHRSRRLATDDPASDALSPLAALSRGGARPASGSTCSSLVGEMGRAPPVDFCHRYEPQARPRTSELHGTTPAVARWCSFALAARPFGPPTSRGWRRTLSDARPAERSRARGLASRRWASMRGTSHLDRSR